MKTSTNYRIIIVILLLYFPFACLADVMPDPLTAGESPKPFSDEKTEVRMVAEDVLVRVHPDRITTVASFNMLNEGEAETIEVGFPYAYEGNFKEFVVFVDGKEVPVYDGKQDYDDGRKKTTVRWKLWEMTFEQNVAYTIRVEYQTDVYEHRHTLVWTDSYISMTQAEIDRFQEMARRGSVRYLLYTGAAWKGILDTCCIEIELVGKSNDNIQSFWPENGIATGNGIKWEYQDYEPSHSVGFRYYPDIPVSAIPDSLLGLIEKYPHDVHLASDVGRELRSSFQEDELCRMVFHSFLDRWDEPIPQLMEYAAGGGCRYSFKGEGGRFYTLWRMAQMLFNDYERNDLLDSYHAIAPKVSYICTAIIDSLETCANLPENNASLFEKAKMLRNRSDKLIDSEN